MLIEIIDSGMIDISLIDNSVLRLLNEKFTLGLFENPYVDVDYADKTVNNEIFQERAALALRKSIVLLRNEKDALPLKSKTKVYFESLQRNARVPVSDVPNVYLVNDNKYDVEFVKTPGRLMLLSSGCNQQETHYSVQLEHLSPFLCPNAELTFLMLIN